MNVDPNRETLEHVIGDSPDLDDIDQEVSSKLGVFDLQRGMLGRVRVRYRDIVVFCEVYQHPGEPMLIHWLCPKCNGGGNGGMSSISGARKRIEYDPTVQREDGGRLNVEAFQCTWEAGEGRRMEFGLGLCGLRLVIDNSVARDA